jgi:hypothetical protein
MAEPTEPVRGLCQPRQVLEDRCGQHIFCAAPAPVPAARPGWFIPSLRPQVELILQLLTLTIWQFVAKTPSGAK